MLTVNFFYPPFVYFFKACETNFGVAPLGGCAYQGDFCTVLSLSVFGITRSLLKDNAIAPCWRWSFVNLYPEATVLSHTSMLDFPVMAMVALSSV